MVPVRHNFDVPLRGLAEVIIGPAHQTAPELVYRVCVAASGGFSKTATECVAPVTADPRKKKREQPWFITLCFTRWRTLSYKGCPAPLFRPDVHPQKRVAVSSHSFNRLPSSSFAQASTHITMKTLFYLSFLLIAITVQITATSIQPSKVLNPRWLNKASSFHGRSYPSNSPPTPGKENGQQCSTSTECESQYCHHGRCGEYSL